MIGLPTERLGEAARLLARCFYANPNFTRSPGTHPLQPSRRLVASLMHALIDLPEQIVGQTEIPEHRSLAARNLRGAALGLASGEAVAREMGVEPLSAAEPGWRPAPSAPGRFSMVDLLRCRRLDEDGVKEVQKQDTPGSRLLRRRCCGLNRGAPHLDVAGAVLRPLLRRRGRAARGLHDDPTIGGILHFLGLFVPVWWTWIGSTWYATAFDNDDVLYW